MIAIIPARGGSKRLPGKNIKVLDGVPIINRVIRIAQESMLFTHVIVSTDSSAIRNIVGDTCQVIMRPDRICGDVPEDNVLDDVISQYDTNEFCRIYPFAALLTPDRLRAGYLEYKTGNYDAVLECQKYGHPTQREFTLDKGYIYHGIIGLPTGELLPTYHDAGTFMFTNTDSLNMTLAERNIKWLPVKEQDAQDIDDEDDWKMMEIKWRNKNAIL